MKRKQLSMLILAMAGSMVLSGCVHSHRQVAPTGRAVVVKEAPKRVVVHEAPPPARQEVVPTTAPSTAHAWVPGYWTYSANRWVWVPGHWQTRPRTAAIWVPGQWDRDSDGRGWVWTPGHWE